VKGITVIAVGDEYPKPIWKIRWDKRMAEYAPSEEHGRPYCIEPYRYSVEDYLDERSYKVTKETANKIYFRKKRA